MLVSSIVRLSGFESPMTLPSTSLATRRCGNALGTSVLVLVAILLAGCVDKVALAGNTAADAFSCPREEVVVTAHDEHNYGVAGCGKADLYYCHGRDVDPGTPSQRVEWVCESTEVVLARSQHEDACASACNGGALRCLEGCQDDPTCRSVCNALADGCFQGCTAN